MKTGGIGFCVGSSREDPTQNPIPHVLPQKISCGNNFLCSDFVIRFKYILRKRKMSTIFWFSDIFFLESFEKKTDSKIIIFTSREQTGEQTNLKSKVTWQGRRKTYSSTVTSTSWKSWRLEIESHCEWNNPQAWNHEAEKQHCVCICERAEYRCLRSPKSVKLPKLFSGG